MSSNFGKPGLVPIPRAFDLHAKLVLWVLCVLLLPQVCMPLHPKFRVTLRFHLVDNGSWAVLPFLSFLKEDFVDLRGSFGVCGDELNDFVSSCLAVCRLTDERNAIRESGIVIFLLRHLALELKHKGTNMLR